MSPLEALAREWLEDFVAVGEKSGTVKQLIIRPEVVASLTALLGKVRTEERERCAAIADQHCPSYSLKKLGNWGSHATCESEAIAAAIRSLTPKGVSKVPETEMP